MEEKIEKPVFLPIWRDGEQLVRCAHCLEIFSKGTLIRLRKCPHCGKPLRLPE